MFYDIVWIFLIYGFLGWCMEVVLATLKTGKFVNRGFLNGPICPIYGVSVIAVLALLTPVKWNLPLFLIGSILLTTSLEFMTGFILEKRFDTKWWNYTGVRFNLWGYVCLKMSLLWGLACVFMVYIFQPIVDRMLHLMPRDVGSVIAGFLVIVLIIDLIVTIAALSKVKQKNNILRDTGDRIKSLSDTIGQNISDNTINAIDIKNKRLQEIDALNRKYQAILSKKVMGYDRIARAFPGLHLEGSNLSAKKSRRKK